MALIVEDGTGLSNAESYVSVADADLYVGDTFFSGDWSTSTTQVKEKLLKNATRLIDSFFDFNGEKAVATSSLRWPRTGVYDKDGIEVSSTAVPRGIVYATVEMAIALQANNFVGENESRGVSSIKVDAIEIQFERSEKTLKIPSSVTHYIRGLGYAVAGSRVGNLILA